MDSKKDFQGSEKSVDGSSELLAPTEIRQSEIATKVQAALSTIPPYHYDITKKPIKHRRNFSSKSLVLSVDVPNPPRFVFTRKALDKARYLAWRSETEVGWLWVVKEEPGVVLVVDLWVMPQKVTTTKFEGTVNSDFLRLRERVKAIHGKVFTVHKMGHTHNVMSTTPSDQDLKKIGCNNANGKSILGWGVIVNRAGDFRLFMTQVQDPEIRYVEYIPWEVDESITWDWDVNEIEEILRSYVQGWRPFKDSRDILEGIFRREGSVPFESANAASVDTSESNSEDIQPRIAPLAQTTSAEQSEVGRATNEARLPVSGTKSESSLDETLPKVTYDPKWVPEYIPQIKRKPDNPNWIDIEGFGMLIREEALAGKIIKRARPPRPDGKRQSRRLLVKLLDGRECEYRILPEHWRLSLI